MSQALDTTAEQTFKAVNAWEEDSTDEWIGTVRSSTVERIIENEWYTKVCKSYDHGPVPYGECDPVLLEKLFDKNQRPTCELHDYDDGVQYVQVTGEWTTSDDMTLTVTLDPSEVEFTH